MNRLLLTFILILSIVAINSQTLLSKLKLSARIDIIEIYEFQPNLYASSPTRHQFPEPFQNQPRSFGFWNSLVNDVVSGQGQWVLSIQINTVTPIWFQFLITNTIPVQNYTQVYLQFLRANVFSWDSIAFTPIVQSTFLDFYSIIQKESSFRIDIGDNLVSNQIYCFLESFKIKREYVGKYHFLKYRCQKCVDQRSVDVIVSSQAQDSNEVQDLCIRYIILNQNHGISVKFEVLQSFDWTKPATTTEIRSHPAHQILLVSLRYYALESSYGAQIDNNLTTSTLHQYNQVSYYVLSISPQDIVTQLLVNKITYKNEQKLIEIECAISYPDLFLGNFSSYQIDQIDNMTVSYPIIERNRTLVTIKYQEQVTGKKNISFRFTGKLHENPHFKIVLWFQEQITIESSQPEVVEEITYENIPYTHNAHYNHITLSHTSDEGLTEFTFLNFQLSNPQQTLISINQITQSAHQLFTTLKYSTNNPTNQNITLKFKSKIMTELNTSSVILNLKINNIELSNVNSDGISTFRSFLQFLSLFIFLFSFPIDSQIGVDLIMFVQLVFYAQIPIQGSIFVHRVRGKSYFLFNCRQWLAGFDSCNVEILEFLRANNYLLLTVLIPLIVGLALFELEKRRTKGKQMKEFKQTVVKATYSFVLANIYSSIVCFAFALQMEQWIEDKKYFLASNGIFIILPIIYEAIYYDYNRQRRVLYLQTYKSIVSASLLHELLKYSDYFIIFAQIYIPPFILVTPPSLVPKSLYIFLTILILKLVFYSFLSKNDQKARKRFSKFTSTVFLIILCVIYISIQSRASQELPNGGSYRYELYDLVSSLILGIVAIQIGITGLILAFEFKDKYFEVENLKGKEESSDETLETCVVIKE